MLIAQNGIFFWKFDSQESPVARQDQQSACDPCWLTQLWQADWINENFFFSGAAKWMTLNTRYPVCILPLRPSLPPSIAHSRSPAPLHRMVLWTPMRSPAELHRCWLCQAGLCSVVKLLSASTPTFPSGKMTFCCCSRFSKLCGCFGFKMQFLGAGNVGKFS